MSSEEIRKRISKEGPNRKPGQKFTIEEDKMILQLVLSVGPKFQKIHKSFPGKTLAMVKNRYYKYLRYRWDVLGQQELRKSRDFKHLNATQDSYETLCEQQRNMSIQLTEQKEDLIQSMMSKVQQLQNARVMVEFFLNKLL
ncbi:hypothetical protein pb186bvf_019026 [Paramecium bursaria]